MPAANQPPAPRRLFFRRRRHLFELHDLSCCPEVIRNGLTDFLQAYIELRDIYRPVLGLLMQALSAAGSRNVVDLCSGAGGPWIHWLRSRTLGLAVTLTDKFPNRRAIRNLDSHVVEGLRYQVGSVDAAAVPATLQGFRTMFTSFHHLPNEVCRNVIQDAVRSREGIAVFEFTHRSICQIFEMLLTPIGVWLLMLRVPQVAKAALLLTYPLPVIPLVACIDGVLSCLRSFTPYELAGMAQAADYKWTSGETGGIVYLIGYPNTSS